MKITTRLIFIIDKYAIRLNFPQSRRFLRKVDRFIFGYGKSFGIPCFCPMIKIKKQLVVDNIPVYSGGGVNCFGEKLNKCPVIINSEILNNCIEASQNGFHKVRNFQYNGFYGRLLEGYAKYTISSPMKTSDPGIYKCISSDGKTKYIPSYAIEGIEIVYKPKETLDIPSLFGVASQSN